MEYLQIHVESSKTRVNTSVTGNEVADKKEFGDMTDVMRYLNSLGAEGWEMVNADRNVRPLSPMGRWGAPHACLICYEMLTHFKNHGRCQRRSTPSERAQ